MTSRVLVASCVPVLLLAGCLGWGAPCTEFEPVASASFTWDGDRDALMQAFRDEGWAADLRPNSLTFDIRRAMGEHVFLGQVHTDRLDPAGNVTMGLRAPGAVAADPEEASDLFAPAWPAFADVQVVFVHGSSRHCGAI